MAQELHIQTVISTCVGSEVEFMVDMSDGKACEQLTVHGRNRANAQSSQCH